MKLYNRLDGVPHDHSYMLVRIICDGDFCGNKREDEIIASAESRNELEQYCASEHIYSIGSIKYEICTVPLSR